MSSFPEDWLYGSRRTLILVPVSWVYRGVIAVRRMLYRLGVVKQTRLPVPVIIIGNIFVGGTGKTPLVLWSARYLTGLGRRPGIVTRGYGGDRNQDQPVTVTAESDPYEVGDEPVLLAQLAGCPVVACRDRVAAAEHLLAHHDCDVILSDDGLQHYRLARDFEVVVVDSGRGLGNGHCLPAGPLREPRSRLRSCDLVIANGGPHRLADAYFTLRIESARRLDDSAEEVDLAGFSGQQAHAVSGIGNPRRFFDALGRYGLDLIMHPFPDHHPFAASDICFSDDLPVFMTEKDAVKCRRFADQRHWVVPARPVIPASSQGTYTAALRRVLDRAPPVPAERSVPARVNSAGR